MAALIERIATQGGATREDAFERRPPNPPGLGRPKAFTSSAYRPDNKAFKLRLSFTKSRAAPTATRLSKRSRAIIRDLRKADK